VQIIGESYSPAVSFMIAGLPGIQEFSGTESDLRRQPPSPNALDGLKLQVCVPLAGGSSRKVFGQLRASRPGVLACGSSEQEANYKTI
jgi:hypothetical protein